MNTNRVVASLCFALVLSALAADASAVQPQRDNTHEAVFHAADVVRPTILKGSNYRIDDRVTLRDNRYVFRVHTRWGTVTAHGTHVLALRLQEMRSIARARRLARRPQVVDGILETAEQTPRGIGVLLENPLGGVLSLPRGLKRLATSKMHPEDRRAGSLTRRRIAYEIGCDPETGNPMLTRLLDNLATRRGAGLLASKIGMSAAVPGLGLVPLTAHMHETVVARLPHEINRDVDAHLAALGVDEARRRRFLRSPHFTTLRRLAFVQQLGTLKGVEGLPVLVAAAADSGSEADALATLDELRLLGKLHESEGIARVAHGQLLTAVLANGTRARILSADFVAGGDAAFTYTVSLPGGRQWEGGTRSEDVLLYCSGRVSREARRTLNASSVRVLQLQ